MASSGNVWWINETKRRGLSCGVDKLTAVDFVAANQSNATNMDITEVACALMPSALSCRFLRKSEIELCESIKGFEKGVETYDNYLGSLKEATRRGLSCDVGNTTKVVSAPKVKSKVTSAALTADRAKRSHQQNAHGLC